MATADSASKGGAIHWKKLTVQGMQGAMDAGGLKSSSSLTDREAQHKPQENYAAKQPVVESGGHKLPQKTQQDEDEDKSGDAQRRETVIESVEPETTTTLVLSSAQVKIAAEKPNSDLERRQRRAERFGVSVQMSEEEKRRIRAQRFGGSSTDASEAKSSGTGDLTKVEEEKKRKARAERFGLPVSSVTDNEEAKKKARLVRFGLDMEEEKREARAARFGLLSKNSTPDVNKKS